MSDTARRCDPSATAAWTADRPVQPLSPVGDSGCTSALECLPVSGACLW